MSEYKLKPGKLGKKIMDAYQGIEDKFVDKFQEEDGSLKTGGMAEKATTAYHKVEDTVVGVYKKVQLKCTCRSLLFLRLAYHDCIW